MSRTTLCVVTAASLTLLSLGVMALRHHALGAEVHVPRSPGTWKVSLLVHGRSQGDARLLTLTPLDFGRQHILRESCQSAEFLDAPPEARHDRAVARHPGRRQILWKKRVGAGNGPFRIHYEFYCSIGARRTSAAVSELARTLAAPPKPGADLDVVRHGDTDAVGELARQLTAGKEQPLEQAEALFHHVDRAIATEPSLAGPVTAERDCLNAGAGDCAAKAHLLVTLLRSRSIPARVVTGLTLTKGPEQHAHHWVEAWVNDRWLPMCPVYHRFGQVPATYLVFSYGDAPVVAGHQVGDLQYAFHVEKVGPEIAADAGLSRRVFLAVSLYTLAPADQELVRFLLLLPVAALIVCLFRNVIGLTSFGTFAPALLGLAFREFHSMPGLLVFVCIVLVGWLMRRVLNHYHLLQVPRTAFLLSLVVVVLVGLVVFANFQSLSATKYVSIFPLVILTGMIERFWTLEIEDGTAASFRTLLQTMIIAGTIALVLSFHTLVHRLFDYPEMIGLMMAGQLLLGRYTGYRFSELLRFRDFVLKTTGHTERAPGHALAD